MRRFRAGNSAALQVPLSDAAERIRREKYDVEHVEHPSIRRTSPEVVNQEDEQFEWREIIRGMSI